MKCCKCVADSNTVLQTIPKNVFNTFYTFCVKLYKRHWLSKKIYKRNVCFNK